MSFVYEISQLNKKKMKHSNPAFVQLAEKSKIKNWTSFYS